MIIYIYIYNLLHSHRICVFPILQLNSNATPHRICPHFVLICFLPIWPSLWKPLYISMPPVSAFFSSSFHILIQFSCQLRGHPGNPCIGGPGASFNPKPRLTKIKNWQGPQIDRFLITLCTKKYIFFLPQRVHPTNGGDPWEMVWIGQVLIQSILGN